MSAPEGSMTAVCSRCGAVCWVAQGHSCPRRLPLSGAYTGQQSRRLQSISDALTVALDQALPSADELAEQTRESEAVA